MKAKWVVRVVIFKMAGREMLVEWMTEHLRYMGVLNLLYNTDEKICVDIYPPKGESNTEAWAESNAMRIRSFNILAVSTPQDNTFLKRPE